MQELFEQAKAAGARGAEALRTQREALEQAGSRSKPTTSREESWVVRVWREGGRAGVGRASTAAKAVTAALAQSVDAPLDAAAGPADKMPLTPGTLGIDDRRHATLSEEDRAEVTQLAERTLGQGGVQLLWLRYRHERVTRSWASTRGIAAIESGTRYSLEAEASLGTVHATHHIASRHFSDVASLPFGQDLRKRLEGLARTAVRPSGSLPWVLEPRVSTELARALAPLFAHEAVAHGNALAAWVGKRLTNVLHINDDAGLASGLYSHSFDDRGVPPIPVPILREGRVGSLYYDVEDARRQGLRPTGHVRDERIQPSNLIIRPGARTRNVILTELKTWVAPDRLPPLDPKTGRFEGPVPFVVVEDGERRGAFTGQLSLGLDQVLGAVSEVASDQERTCEVDAPTLVLSALPIG